VTGTFDEGIASVVDVDDLVARLAEHALLLQPVDLRPPPPRDERAERTVFIAAFEGWLSDEDARGLEEHHFANALLGVGFTVARAGGRTVEAVSAEVARRGLACSPERAQLALRDVLSERDVWPWGSTRSRVETVIQLAKIRTLCASLDRLNAQARTTDMTDENVLEALRAMARPFVPKKTP
jgi:hypothetical protein